MTQYVIDTEWDGPAVLDLRRFDRAALYGVLEDRHGRLIWDHGGTRAEVPRGILRDALALMDAYQAWDTLRIALARPAALGLVYRHQTIERLSHDADNAQKLLKPNTPDTPGTGTPERQP
jgi:hypothetical protein